MELSFTKMQGTGNDFVVIDATKKPFSLSTDTIRSLADRRYGIGFDQMLVVQSDETGQADLMPTAARLRCAGTVLGVLRFTCEATV